MSAKTCVFGRQEESCDKGLPLFVFEAPFLACTVDTHPKEPQGTTIDTWAPSAAILMHLGGRPPPELGQNCLNVSLGPE